MAAKAIPCEWDVDEFGTWSTTCGNAFQFTEGGPTENGCKFCCYCGHPLKEIPAKFDEWGDLIIQDDEEKAND